MIGPCFWLNFKTRDGFITRVRDSLLLRNTWISRRSFFDTLLVRSNTYKNKRILAKDLKRQGVSFCSGIIMKTYCITWTDERWSADEKALKDINEMININVDSKRSFLSMFDTQRFTSFFKNILSLVPTLKTNKKSTERNI